MRRVYEPSLAVLLPLSVSILLLAIGGGAGAEQAEDEEAREMATEVHFAAHVCELTPRQAADLAKAAERTRSPEKAAFLDALFNLNDPEQKRLSVEQAVDLAVQRQLPDEARSRLEDERQKLAGWRRGVAIELMLAALDELLLLSENQRDELRRVLTEKWSGNWRPPANWQVLLGADGHPWQTATARGALAMFSLRETDLAGFLRPWQRRACKDLRVYARRLASEAAPPIIERRNEPLFHLSLDYLDATCRLSERQQTKLRLAVKLDLDQTGRRGPPPEVAPGAAIAVDGVLPAGVVAKVMPAYCKMRGNLLNEKQVERLAEASRERWLFHQSVDVKSMVAVLERQARLTGDQAEALAQQVNCQLPEPSGQSYCRPDTFAAAAKIFARLPLAADADDLVLQPVFAEFQTGLLSKQFAALEQVCRDRRMSLEVQP